MSEISREQKAKALADELVNEVIDCLAAPSAVATCRKAAKMLRAISAEQPAKDAVASWPKVYGTGRVSDNDHCLLVHFAVCPTDDELRDFDEAIKWRMALPSADPRPSEQAVGRPVIPHRSGGGDRPGQEWYRSKIELAGDADFGAGPSERRVWQQQACWFMDEACQVISDTDRRKPTERAAQQDDQPRLDVAKAHAYAKEMGLPITFPESAVAARPQEEGQK